MPSKSGRKLKIEKAADGKNSDDTLGHLPTPWRRIHYPDLLLTILKTHARLLQEFLETFGLTVALHVLESTNERLEEDGVFERHLPASIKRKFVSIRKEADFPLSFLMAEIEAHIDRMHLPKNLEFYLWSFPLYRLFSESEIGPHQDAVFEEKKELMDFVDALQKEWTLWSTALALPDALQKTFQRKLELSDERFVQELLELSVLPQLTPLPKQ